MDVAWSMGTAGGNAANPQGALDWPTRLAQREITLAARVEEARKAGDDPERAAVARQLRDLERLLADVRAVRPAVKAMAAVARLVLEGRPLGEIWPSLCAFLADWLLQHRTLVLGIGAIFFYVGAEVAIGSLIVLLLGLPSIANMLETEAGFYVSLYWGGAMVGRFIGAAVQQVVPPARVLAFSAVLAIVLIGVTVAVGGPLAMWSMLAIGLANAIMFPTIFSLSIAGLGEHTSRGAGLLVMGIVGGALIPVGVGAIADGWGLGAALASTMACYAYIVYFARRAGSA